MNVLRADAVEVVFTGEDPSIRYIKPIGKDSLIDDDVIDPAVVLNRIECSLRGGMHRRYANIDCIRAGCGSGREAPLARTIRRGETRPGPAHIVVLRLAVGDIDVIPALIRGLGKARP